MSVTARRLTGSAFVLALHVALLAMLIYSMRISPTVIPVSREVILRFLPRPFVPPVAKMLPHPAARAKPRNSSPLPDYSGIIWLPVSPHAPSVDTTVPGIDCANPQNLDPQQRLQCSLANTPRLPTGPDYRDHTDRTLQADRWNRERMRKNAPALLPCMSPQSVGIGLGTIICAVKGATQGYDPDEQPGYGDNADTIHVPNNGDPPPIYSPDH
jgi:hypothetical protein